MGQFQLLRTFDPVSQERRLPCTAAIYDQGAKKSNSITCALRLRPGTLPGDIAIDVVDADAKLLVHADCSSRSMIGIEMDGEPVGLASLSDMQAKAGTDTILFIGDSIALPGAP